MALVRMLMVVPRVVPMSVRVQERVFVQQRRRPRGRQNNHLSTVFCGEGASRGFDTCTYGCLTSTLIAIAKTVDGTER
ncbi:hypothetical protein DIPPA_61221 [Diplonema papillatum]|nr:hypothetical protein DIPPA_61221 [Diplonema papillatum]